jgi:ribosomal protein S18 acetylase RimI-like enzyme
MTIQIQGPSAGMSDACAPILRALPQWFGIEQATAQYIRDTDTMPTLTAVAGDQVIGFLSLREHSEFAAEIHVMGVRPEHHRQGVGRALVAEAERLLGKQGTEYLQVKTLSPAHPDKNYALTREFYMAVGFRPLEEFKELWGEANPCLQMIKRIGATT